MIANWRRAGMASRKSSRRLPASSGDVIDKPVTLPPGRARLATRPLPRGSAIVANTIGTTERPFFPANHGGPRRDNDIDLEPDKLNPAEFAQPLRKNDDPLACGGRRGPAQKPDGWQLSRLLRARRERPCCRRATEERHQRAAI